MSDEACVSSSSASDKNPRQKPPEKTPEQIAEENARFNQPVCPCEEEELDPQSEYDVSGEWVTYTGDIDYRIFENAAQLAEEELAEQIRRQSKEPLTEPGTEKVCEQTETNKPPSEHTRRHSAEATASAPSQDEEGAAHASAQEDATVQDTRSENGDDWAQFIAENALEDDDVESLQNLDADNDDGTESAIRILVLGLQDLFSISSSDDEKQEEEQESPSISEEEIDQGAGHEEAADYEAPDEWATFMADEKAKDAAEISRLATDTARAAQRAADEAELAGIPNADSLASEFQLFNKWAKKAAKLANETEKHAVQTRRAWQQSVAGESKAVLRAPPTEPHTTD